MFSYLLHPLPKCLTDQLKLLLKHVIKTVFVQYNDNYSGKSNAIYWLYVLNLVTNNHYVLSLYPQIYDIFVYFFPLLVLTPPPHKHACGGICTGACIHTTSFSRILVVKIVWMHLHVCMSVCMHLFVCSCACVCFCLWMSVCLCLSVYACLSKLSFFCTVLCFSSSSCKNAGYCVTK